jgi:heterodisulfide reductase subunit C
MDALRIIAVSEGYPTPEKDAPAFHRLFLGLVGQFGRMHEASLMVLFKLRTGNLTSDMDSGLRMLLKGKIPLLPHRVKAMKDVKRIYRQTGG